MYTNTYWSSISAVGVYLDLGAKSALHYKKRNPDGFGLTAKLPTDLLGRWNPPRLIGTSQFLPELELTLVSCSIGDLIARIGLYRLATTTQILTGDRYMPMTSV